ncbi:MAG: hypothetical protein FP825_17960 [Hyphomonas sp.]|uniref:HAAS signaling domain-containing protein n=1 Tax=Hyphomonas sp. TaxID=87 RepID=UPI0017FCEE3C|nr:hypothetical protein [Hyphomonas sp.]MBU3920422.1 hypothetical protein [Alphaproteobacteria bacterium]MBA3070347.1 hypothetical protein [Hyphomonas sp.]MBU4062834.1 hypothetical protein [Alphaproteobacteria bacterium]MBU4163753.1 hypothetical protein [Alphaproteobacteria bacterium]MBU4567930.1 hypothetical protein [Alphaproteobacteria bacterium]
MSDVTLPALDAYLAQLDLVLAPLGDSERQEILQEIRAHLADSAAAEAGDDTQRAASAIRKLGSARVVGQAYLSESLLERASHGLRPGLTAMGLMTALGGGLGMTALGLVFSFGYLALTIIAIATVGKLIVPASGLWLHDTGAWSLSFEAMPNSREVLGWWIIPIGTSLVLGGWFALNRLLRIMLRFTLPRPKF